MVLCIFVLDSAMEHQRKKQGRVREILVVLCFIIKMVLMFKLVWSVMHWDAHVSKGKQEIRR
jgi:hypothetical protein